MAGVILFEVWRRHRRSQSSHRSSGVLPHGWQAEFPLSPYSHVAHHQKIKNPPCLSTRDCLFEVWRCPTLTWGDPTLPSALVCFTSGFGMEPGGAIPLWPPDINCHNMDSADCFATLLFNSIKRLTCSTSKHLGCCMVKSHGQLVRVSSTPYNASTPRLSTSSSATTLQST